MLELPEAIISGNENIFGAPVKIGDRLKTRQVLKSISDVKKTRVGMGRFWVIEVESVNQDGEHVGTDIYTCFGYRRAVK
jgi:acyl dehydratase